MASNALCFALLFAGSAIAYCDEPQPMTTVAVDVLDRKVVDESTSTKWNVSPVLMAVRDSGGVLKGSESRGKIMIIEVPKGGVEKLQSSKAVKSVKMEVPEAWTPVVRLKLSYGPENRPTEEEVKDLGFKLIEDYRKGSFMVIEPVGEQKIDAKLVSKLEENKKIEFATAVFRVKAIQ